MSFFIRRLGEYNKEWTQDEKYSHRMRMVRKKQNKRASKFSLEKETDLTHFGKRIGDMSKTELRQAYVGSGDEADVPFSYESLIAQSKEQRAEARRQKMEAEAELQDLDDSFKTMFGQLERRDMDKDKLENAVSGGDDDLAFLARSFQMDIKKAMAGERSVSALEKEAAHKQLVSQSLELRDAAATHDYNSENEDENGEVLIESDNDTTPSTPATTTISSAGLFELIRKLVPTPSQIPDQAARLIELARSTPGDEIDEFFKQNLFSDTCADFLPLLKIVTVLFPLDHLRHAIAVPALKLLEKDAMKPEAGLAHLVLLFELLGPGSKYTPTFLSLAGRLYRAEKSSEETKSSIVSLTSLFCSKFTREALYGPIQSLFPELLSMIASEEPFTPMRLHQFKPVEVLSLEPAYHEDGEQWNGQHKELRAQKKLERQVKQDKRLTAKEMRREAIATESFHAIQKAKEKAQAELQYKRTVTKMLQAEQNYKQMRTDNGKDDGRRMKSNKKRRQ